MDGWKVGWAREDGHIKQAQAPGHDRPRCVYVDFLSTGPAVSRTLRTRLNDASGIRRIGDLLIVDITVRDGEACGATALHLSTGRIVPIAAKAVVIATGGLTQLYRRNSASSNMGGDGYALALRAGAPAIMPRCTRRSGHLRHMRRAPRSIFSAVPNAVMRRTPPRSLPRCSP